MSSRRLALVLAVLAAPVGPAGAIQGAPPAPVSTTTFVISGHGWGHGVGMGQWGAYGYAKHGVTYDKILAHYYPGTKLAQAPDTRLKVLLIEQAHAILVSSPDPFWVRDGAKTLHRLAAGDYALGPLLSLRLHPGMPARRLPGPLSFLPGKSPLWLAHPYRGSFVVASDGKSLSVVNVVALDSYTRGVVSSEMPRDWPLEAVKAQAVAARSYALAHRRGGTFDVYADTRDQVYGGILAETPVGDAAVDQTRRQVLLFDGKVANTYFFSSSGGRTAAITDVFAGSKPTPYLVSVPDPYDSASPWHNWGPLPLAAATAARILQVPGLTDLRSVPPNGRARSIVAVGRNGENVLAAGDVRRALGLRSTWVSIGVLSLSRTGGTVAPGTTVTLSGRAARLSGVKLEQRTPGGGWQPGPAPKIQADGSFALDVAPTATVQYRLSAGGIRSAALSVVVGG